MLPSIPRLTAHSFFQCLTCATNSPDILPRICDAGQTKSGVADSRHPSGGRSLQILNSGPAAQRLIRGSDTCSLLFAKKLPPDHGLTEVIAQDTQTFHIAVPCTKSCPSFLNDAEFTWRRRSTSCLLSILQKLVGSRLRVRKPILGTFNYSTYLGKLGMAQVKCLVPLIMYSKVQVSSTLA